MATQNLAIMFTDISGYTEKTQRYTRDQMKAFLNVHNSLLLPLVRRFRGRHIKSIGDALLCVFQSPTDALLCSMAMQDTLFSYNLKQTEDKRIRIKIGINVGEVRAESNDVFGDAVNLCSRIQNITPPEEIYFSDAVYLAMNKAEVAAQEVGLKTVKGVQDPLKIWSIPRFLSSKLVADPSMSTADLSSIALPFGGAHLHLPPESFMQRVSVLCPTKTISIIIAIFFASIVFTLIYNNKNQTADVESTSKNLLSQADLSAGAEKLLNVLSSKITELEVRKDEVRKQIVTDNDTGALYAKKVSIDEYDLLLERLHRLVPEELELQKPQTNSSTETINTFIQRLRSYVALVETLRSIADSRIDILSSLHEFEEVRGNQPEDLPQVQLARELLLQSSAALERGDYGTALKLISTAKPLLPRAISLEKRLQLELKKELKSAEQYNERGLDALINRQYESAIVWYSLAERAAPGGEGYVSSLANAYDLNREPAVAIFLLESVTKQYDAPWALQRMGMIRLRTGEYKQAAYDFETALKYLKPDDEKFTSTYGEAQAYEGSKDLPKALALYQSALALLENDPNEGSEQPLDIREQVRSKIKELSQKKLATIE